MKVRFAEIASPGADSVYHHAWWTAQLKSFCSFRHSSRRRGSFPNWNEIRGPGYHVWFSEPMWEPTRAAFVIRVEVLQSSKVEGIEIFDGIVATTLQCLSGATVTATGIEEV